MYTLCPSTGASQYFFPAIIYRDIISHITITYRYIMYFFRTFKKSTATYKVHYMGLRYINIIFIPLDIIIIPLSIIIILLIIMIIPLNIMIIQYAA
jgi:hypothetical protein